AVTTTAAATAAVAAAATAAAAAAVAAATAAVTTTAAATAAVAAAATAAAAAAGLTGTRLVDGPVPTAGALPVQTRGRLVGGRTVGHPNEPESLGRVRVAVDDDLRREDLAILTEQLHQVVLGGVVRQVADIELLGHCLSSAK